MSDSTLSRREFVKTSTAVAIGSAVASNIVSLPGAYAQGSDEIRVGVIGCGGRGSGAIGNVLESAPGVRIVAIGDAFKDRLEQSQKNLTKYGEKAFVPPDRRFVGLDAYEKVIASDANYIILASPPAFRPQHLKAAVAAGKNLFTEKPVAVDPAGIRTVLDVYEQAKAKGLAIGAGTQRRHQTGYLQSMERIKGGAIGDIVAARCYWNMGGLWSKPREPQWSDLEWQLRNWLYFTWLSGDHIVEQHVHNIDVVNWAIGAHPLKATAVGGRQQRTDPAYGHIFDHFAVDFEYPNGVHAMSMCRQWQGTPGRVAENLVGTKGMADLDNSGRYTFTGANPWKFPGEDNKPYTQEHTDLIASIRAGKPYNELKDVAESTFSAIMGRTAAYTGQIMSWDALLASGESIVPPQLSFGPPMAVPPVPVPGAGATSSGM